MKKKIYGQTFLTRPIKRIKSFEKADASIFHWRWNKETDDFTLSRLGFINGILGFFGYILFVNVTDGRIDNYKLLRKFW